MLQTLIDQKTVKPGNWSSLTVFLWFQLSKMGLYSFILWGARAFMAADICILWLRASAFCDHGHLLLSARSDLQMQIGTGQSGTFHNLFSLDKICVDYVF